MTRPPSDFELIYHAAIPGRGEFIRLFFEATATPYKDSALIQGQSAILPYLNGSFPGHDANPLPFAPPILRHGDVVISQTSNILLYLATHLESPIDLSPSSSSLDTAPATATVQDTSIYHVQSLALTILDLNNETHDTHHPVSVSSYYEDQKEPALLKARDFRQNRVPKFFKYFEALLEREAERGGWLVRGGVPSYADLCLFQVVDGLKFAFPNLLSKLLPLHPRIRDHHERVKSAKRIKEYLDSDRRQEYSMGVFRYYEELDEPK
ncbi:hypothetical protein JCM11491_006903 [Sporobolomyces phaffii]